MSTSSVEEFVSDSHRVLDELKGYCANNYASKLGARESVRYISEHFTMIINMAVSLLKASCTTEILEQRLANLATKEDLIETTTMQNEKFTLAIREVKEEIDKLCKVQHHSPLGENGSPTISYSDALKRDIRPPQPTLEPPMPIHTVLVFSDNKENSSEKTRALLTNNINPREVGLGVKRLRKINNGGVAVDLVDVSDVEFLQEKVNDIPGLSARIAKKQRPLLKLAFVPISVPRETLTKSIYEQNLHFHTSSSYESYEMFESDVQVKFPIKQRDPNYITWVIQVSPEIREMLLKKGKICVEWTRCPIYDFVPTNQCFRCLRFGHRARDCMLQTMVCSHCGEDHLFKDCTNKHKRPRCANCVRENNKEHDHNTMDRRCQTYLRAKAQAIERTDYVS
ncbi:uncharacterized protein LOC111621218 [Centruroides sculpturatus]|uniref:uncharacterized protein LOC111621218 n=1 Tax=Centruroides sculpturatus TaxID=218467 RepID=UPI000C6E490B|nr:uncharacterized protein LOC111621218 [Centruroides sculpturatus]